MNLTGLLRFLIRQRRQPEWWQRQQMLLRGKEGGAYKSVAQRRGREGGEEGDRKGASKREET